MLKEGDAAAAKAVNALTRTGSRQPQSCGEAFAQRRGAAAAQPRGWRRTGTSEATREWKPRSPKAGNPAQAKTQAKVTAPRGRRRLNETNNRKGAEKEPIGEQGQAQEKRHRIRAATKKRGTKEAGGATSEEYNGEGARKPRARKGNGGKGKQKANQRRSRMQREREPQRGKAPRSAAPRGSRTARKPKRTTEGRPPPEGGTRRRSPSRAERPWTKAEKAKANGERKAGPQLRPHHGAAPASAKKTTRRRKPAGEEGSAAEIEGRKTRQQARRPRQRENVREGAGRRGQTATGEDAAHKRGK